jgi:2-methylisocitrate lyase-like PEP mutase family enzyme
MRGVTRILIIARTDAVAAAGAGFDDAVKRGKAFARVGADMVWAEFPSADAEIDFQKRLVGHPMGAFHELAGFPKVKEQESKYLPAEELKKKYDGAVGL